MTTKKWPRVLAGVLGALLAVVGSRFLPPSLLPVQATPKEGTPVPAVMYHNVLPNGSKGLGTYVISAEELEGDLALLQKAGYTGVTPKELSDWLCGVGSLPEKPVLLTFDDGYETMATVVLPLLGKYQFKATAAIVGKYTDFYSGDVPKEPAYSHLSWDQVKALSDSGLVEIASHSYDLHELDKGRKGLRINKGEDLESYRRDLSNDLLLLQEKCRDHLGREPFTLVYPYGFYTRESEELAAEFGFGATVTCEEGVSYLKDKGSLFALKRYNRPHGTDREAFFKKMGITLPQGG